MCSAIPRRPAVPIATTDYRTADFQGLPHALGRPTCSGLIRGAPADFRVIEELAFPLTGTGEHLYFRVRKTGQNTRWVAKQIAKSLNLPYRAVGYAGLKDRHADCEQWFSAHLPGRAEPAPEAIDIDGVTVLETRRHATKLRIGALAGNRFRIVVRGFQGERAECEARLGQLRDAPVPNYFGPQRFGHGGGNLDLLRRSGPLSREARSFGLSALRSVLFNAWLAERIEDRSWQTPLPGEIVYCEAGRGYKHIDRVSDADGVVRPTGLLWGLGDNQSTGPAAERECDFFERHAGDTELLARHEVRMVRRPLGCVAQNLDWTFGTTSLELEFRLRKGQFATVVLREIINITERD